MGFLNGGVRLEKAELVYRGKLSRESLGRKGGPRHGLLLLWLLRLYRTCRVQCQLLSLSDEAIDRVVRRGDKRRKERLPWWREKVMDGEEGRCSRGRGCSKMRNVSKAKTHHPVSTKQKAHRSSLHTSKNESCWVSISGLHCKTRLSACPLASFSAKPISSCPSPTLSQSIHTHFTTRRSSQSQL